MPLDLPDAEAPESVELDRAATLSLRWADGTERRYELAELRRNCPCAECRGLREQGQTPGPGPDAPITAIDAELVGGWGLSIRWSDGHSTGIYAWSILRMWDGPAT
ncbi:MAG: DUF971 domain-containing protein [Actinomycetota bacterium]